MAPQSVLSKMKMGVGAAGVILAFGYAECGLTLEKKTPEPPTKEEPPKEPAVKPLTKDQLETLRLTIPKLAAEEFETRMDAYGTLLEMGKGALAPLHDALKTANDPEIRSSLNKLIVELDPKKTVVNENKHPCVKCSRG